MNKQINNLFQAEMTRKEFLTTCGLGIISILGFSSFLKFFSQQQQGSQQRPSGYGSSPYGK